MLKLTKERGERRLNVSEYLAWFFFYITCYAMCTVAAILLAATVHVAFAVYMIAVRQSSLSNTHTASWRHGFLRGHSNSNITHPTTTQYLLAGTHIQCRSIINTLSTAPWVIISLISLKDVQSEERRWKEWGVRVRKKLFYFYDED